MIPVHTVSHYGIKTLKPFKPYNVLLITSYCARKDCLCVHRFCVSKKDGIGWGHPQGDMHIVAKCHGWDQEGQFLPGCMDRLRKHYSHLLGCSFLAGKAAWVLSADHCMLINEWAWLTSWVCLLRLEVDLGSVLESELGQKWRYGVLKACIG